MPHVSRWCRLAQSKRTEDTEEDRILLPLPPYSPELNPIEHVWDFLRENAFGNKNFNSLDEVEDTLCSALQYLIQHPSVVKSLTWVSVGLILLCMTSN